MSWIITHDHLHASDPKSFPNSAVGRGEGQAGEKPTTQFKLYDDDGELYYTGRMTLERLNGDESQAFAPLDWAMYDAGCTELRYRDPLTKVWRTL